MDQIDQSPKAGTLYVVGLPIGSPFDITLRAKNILEKVDIVAAEDTRVFRSFCSTLSITPPEVLSYYDQNEEGSAAELLKFLQKGRSIAIVPDAGTPGVSDPGYRLVSLALAAHLPVVPIPGASALTAALSISSVGGASHIFLGFPPKELGALEALYQRVKGVAHKVVIFESPHRIKENLDVALKIFGDVQVSLMRELTKKYEEHIYGTISRCLQKLPSENKGEFVIIFDSSQANELSPIEIKNLIAERLEGGHSRQDVIAEFRSPIWTRQQIYNLIEEIKVERPHLKK